jgi:predicted RNA-binding Zn-ribbon protein involved in translation (DUF1610 family)
LLTCRAIGKLVTMDFDCPNCGAQYKIVRVERDEVLPDEQIACLRCDAPLNGREGRLTLKYFLLDSPRLRAQKT